MTRREHRASPIDFNESTRFATNMGLALKKLIGIQITTFETSWKK